MPVKTGLTLLTFVGLILLPQVAPALRNYKSLDPHNIPAVFDFPLRKIPGDAPTNLVPVEQLRAARLQATSPKKLIDPAHTLDSFYQSLLKGGVTNIVHYGDSPTTADLITADARAMLQRQFGDAGIGFVLLARPWAWYGRRGVEMESSNWKIDIAGTAELKDGMHGLGGVSFRGSPSAVARWKLRNGSQQTVEIAYLAQPDGGAFAVDAVLNGDEKEIGTADTAAEERSPGFAAFAIPPGSSQIRLRVTRGTVRLYGADFRKASPGVVYSSLGINGANVTLLSRAFNLRHWEAELHHYQPDLIIINYGTNESGFPKFVDSTWAGEMKEAVRRLHAAIPGVPVLLMSPMDRGERNTDGEIDTIPTMPRLVAIESRVASEMGVAFFNTFEAMGGEGTMARWYEAEPRLVGADYIHPMPAGAKIVGELLYNALRDGYNEYKLRQLNERALRDQASQARQADQASQASAAGQASPAGQPGKDQGNRESGASR
jgi:lysophospholipase L1-like esterase